MKENASWLHRKKRMPRRHISIWQIIRMTRPSKPISRRSQVTRWSTSARISCLPHTSGLSWPNIWSMGHKRLNQRGSISTKRSRTGSPERTLRRQNPQISMRPFRSMSSAHIHLRRQRSMRFCMRCSLRPRQMVRHTSATNFSGG